MVAAHCCRHSRDDPGAALSFDHVGLASLPEPHSPGFDSAAVAAQPALRLGISVARPASERFPALGGPRPGGDPGAVPTGRVGENRTGHLLRRLSRRPSESPARSPSPGGADPSPRATTTDSTVVGVGREPVHLGLATRPRRVAAGVRRGSCSFSTRQPERPGTWSPVVS